MDQEKAIETLADSIDTLCYELAAFIRGDQDDIDLAIFRNELNKIRFSIKNIG